MTQRHCRIIGAHAIQHNNPIAHRAVKGVPKHEGLSGKLAFFN